MKRIFLIGYMGAGKTTLGKAVAKATGLSFIDLDWHIEERYRKKIAQLFSDNGEEGFRKIERAMLHEVGSFEDVLIATGGGTPCFYDNMDFMNQNGDTVLLQASHEVLFNRLSVAKQQRPILKNMSDEELDLFIDKALESRMPYYSQAKQLFCADKLESISQLEQSVNAFCELMHLDVVE